MSLQKMSLVTKVQNSATSCFFHQNYQKIIWFSSVAERKCATQEHSQSYEVELSHTSVGPTDAQDFKS